jgi:hypothetical protein
MCHSALTLTFRLWARAEDPSLVQATYLSFYLQIVSENQETTTNAFKDEKRKESHGGLGVPSPLRPKQLCRQRTRNKPEIVRTGPDYFCFLGSTVNVFRNLSPKRDAALRAPLILFTFVKSSFIDAANVLHAARNFASSPLPITRVLAGGNASELSMGDG